MTALAFAPAPPVLAARLPRDDAGRLAWLRLARSRNVGAATFRTLMSHHASAERALEALPALASRGGARDYVPAAEAEAAEEMARARDAGARMLCLGAPDYPALLARIADPPPVLWAQGDADLGARPAVALVGARNASALGARLAQMLAHDLGAAGHVIVSGLARGIDTAAHLAALGTGTIAVLAGGLDRVYPEENAPLAARIAAAGLVVSEAPMGLDPQARHFPRRNRLVSGLSRGVVLVEAAERSGSLITARCALEQGREVMAVPGSPLDPRAGGCNALLREGAILVRSAADVEEALALPAPRGFAEPPYVYAADAPVDADPDLPARIEALLGRASIDEDGLIRALGAPPAQVMEALIELDLAGRIDRHPGGAVSLVA